MEPVKNEKKVLCENMVVENIETRNSIFEMAKRYLGKQRHGIHVSALINPLKHYYRVKNPDIVLSDRQVGYFLAGRGHHSIIQMLATLPQFREVSVEWMGIRGTIDIMENSVVEIKSTRFQTPLTPEQIVREHSDWLTQINFYRAMVNTMNAQLWIFYLGVKEKNGSRTTPELRVFNVGPCDIEAIRTEMLKRKQLLEEALETNQPELLKQCPQWMCRDCEFKNVCFTQTQSKQSLEVNK